MYQWISWSFIATFHPLDLVNFCSPCKVMQLSAEFAEVHSQVVHCQAGLPNPPFLTSFGNRQISADLFKQILTAAPNQVQPDIWRLWNLSWIVWRKRWRMKLNATRPPSTRQGFSDIWFTFGTGLAPDNPGIRHKNSQQSKCDHTLIQLSWGKRSWRHDVFFAAWFESICWRSQRRAEGGRIHKTNRCHQWLTVMFQSCYVVLHNSKPRRPTYFELRKLLCQEIASHSQQLEGELNEAKINQAHVGGELFAFRAETSHWNINSMCQGKEPRKARTNGTDGRAIGRTSCIGRTALCPFGNLVSLHLSS